MRRMDDMDELMAWIREQLDVDERVALAAKGHSLFDGTGIVISHTGTGSRSVVVGSHVATHIARFDPDRVLRQVEATRRILDEHYIIERKVNWTDGEGEDRQTHLPVCVVCVPKYSYIGTRDQAVGPCKTVKLLALPLADRPGYRSEWAPADA